MGLDTVAVAVAVAVANLLTRIFLAVSTGLQNLVLNMSKVSFSWVFILVIVARHIGQDKSSFSNDSARIY